MFNRIRLNQLKSSLINLYHHQFFRKNLWTLIARIACLTMQLGYFVLIARMLTLGEYGMFIGISALASLLLSFGSLGSGDILIKNISRNREMFRDYWGNALLTSSLASFLLIAVCLVVTQLFFPEKGSVLVVFLILLSDIFCLTLWNIAGDAFSSVDLLYKVAQTDLLYSANKLMAAIILTLGVWSPNLTTWAWLYCGSSVLTALLTISIVNQSIAWPRFKPRMVFSNIKEGLYFSLSYSAEKINGDIDKTMLASAASFQATGLYAAGSRFLTSAYAPLQMLFNNSYMRYFKHGEAGITGSFGFAKRLLPVVLGYGAATTLVFLALSPLVPQLLGESYQDTVIVLRWLSPYVLMLGVQAIAADTLTGAGFQSWRSGVNVGAAILNISLNFWLIPQYSWKGAVWATLISDSSKLLVLWLMVLGLTRRAKRCSVTGNTFS